jgi:nitroreductase
MLAGSGRNSKFLTESPVVVVGCVDQEASSFRWCVVDVAIAMQCMVLAATSEGLGTCWVGGFDERQVKEMLKAPRSPKAVAILALGYPRQKLDLGWKLLKVVRRPKQLEEIASHEEYAK